MEIFIAKITPIALVVILSVIAYFLRKYIVWEELKPIMTDIAKMIMDIEKEQKRTGGAAKMELLEKTIATTLPETDLLKIKKSPFRTIKRFAQFVFTTIAEKAILSRLKP